MHKQPKIAIVGIGRWGKKLLREFDRQTEVSAVSYNGSAETSAWLIENYPTIPYLELEKICQSSEIQAVVVATPPVTHYQIAKQILESHKDVWVEKPVGIKITETAMLTKLAQTNGRVLFTGYTYLYHPAWSKIKQLFAERKETPIWLNVSWHKWGSFATSIEENLLCHDISLAQDLFSTPLDAERLIIGNGANKTDILVTKLSIREQIIGLSYINRLSAEKNKEVTVKSKNDLILIWHNDKLYEVKKDQLTEILIDLATALERECQAFLGAINNKQTPITDGAFAFMVRQTLDNITSK